MFNKLTRPDKQPLYSDSKIKDVMIWDSTFNKNDLLINKYARATEEDLPNKGDILWVFNGRSSLIQSGVVALEEVVLVEGTIKTSSLRRFPIINSNSYQSNHKSS